MFCCIFENLFFIIVKYNLYKGKTGVMKLFYKSFLYLQIFLMAYGLIKAIKIIYSSIKTLKHNLQIA